MAATGYRTVMIQGCEVRLEGIAGAGTIKPGHLLTYSSGNVIIHGTADGAQERLFAIESPTADHATTANIDLAYASGDTVYMTRPAPGDVMYAWLATGNTTVIGVSQLVSNGDGTLKIATLGAGTLTNAIVGVPEEVVANASGSAVRLKIRVN